MRSLLSKYTLFVFVLFLGGLRCEASTATFLRFDTTTQGTWPGTYGHDGYTIANYSNALPSYAALGVNGASLYTWESSTSDPRALETSTSGSNRIASTYYSSNLFSFDINLTDGATHQLALYLLDFDSTGRAETITVSDASSNTALDSRSVSNFHNGLWVVWTLQGHVVIQVTCTGGMNAVVSGLFFDPSSSSSPAPPTVSITAPSAGPVSGSVTVSASASSTVGISSVQFRLDGSNLGAAVTAAPYSISWNTSTAGAGTHTLTAIATDTTGQQTTSAGVTVTVSSGSTPTFVGADTSTQGNWPGKYGGDGYIIANDATNPPSYATVNISGASAYTWYPSTTDPRALFTSPSSGTRIASTYYSSSGFTFDINLTDGQIHTVALYCLDLDTSGRAEQITVLNMANEAVLDQENVSNFHNGEYLVWNLSGHVEIQVTYTAGLNAVVSGIFFGGAGTTGSGGGTGTTPPPAVSLTNPAGGTVSGTVTVSASATSSAGIASVQFQLDGANLGAAVTSAPYSSSWNTTTASNATHTLTAIATDTLGQKTTSAGVMVTVNNVAPTGSSATFIKTDTTTQGNWSSLYGHDGYVIANDANNPPGYATLGSSGATSYTWFSSTTDPRALLTAPSASTRIASTFYTFSTLSFSIAPSDSLTHQLALYCVDFDHAGRTETITIVNANTNAILNSQQLSNFGNGTYLVWDFQGPITVQVTNTGYNAVVSGLFFDPGSGSTPAPPTVSITSPTGGTVSGSITVSANASAPAGVATVQFQLDNTTLGSAITGSGPYSTSWNTTTASDGSHTLKAIATDTLGQSTTSAAVNVTVSNAAPSSNSAIFEKADWTTQGTWTNSYGLDGYLVANASNSPPSYATLNWTGSSLFTWQSPTADPRALLQSPSTSNRIASTYYASSTFQLDLNLTDGQTHQVAMYFLDWDNSGRAQKVTILDASTQNTLDSRSISNFQAGEYLVWNITGHVLVQFTPTAGPNAVVNGVFFGQAEAAPPPPPVLTLSTTALNFTATVGAANPAGQSVNITNTGAGTLTWSATKTQSWLTLSPSGTTGPGSLGLSISTSGLTAGTYNDTITITAPGASGSPQTVKVTLTMVPAPALTLSTNTATFSATVGAANPTGQSVNITNTGGGTLTWSAAKTQSWLTLSPSGTTAPGSLGLSISTAGLNAGTYTDTVTVTASGATGSPQQITVTLTMIAPPALALSTTTATFSATIGAANPTGQSVNITNTGGGTLTWSASKTQSWLTLTPSGTTAPGSLGLTISTTGLNAGTYTDTVTITAPGATGSPQTVSVTLTMIPPPVLTLSTTTASFTATVGAANPTAQSVNITNTGGGTMTWSATKTQSWLTLSPSGTTAPGSLGLNILTTGLAAGTYNDTISVTAPGATNSPQTIMVTLTMIPPPILTVSTTSATFTATVGAANPTSQSINITNTGGGTLTWSASNTQAWLTLAPSGATAPSSLGLNISTTGLAAGTYTDTVTITAPGAVGSPQTVSVTLTLVPPPTLTLSTSGMNINATIDFPAPTASVVNITNTGGGTLNWTAAKTQSWLNLSSTSGTAPSQLSVSVSIGGLQAGTYSDTITITGGANTVNSPQTVNVTLNVTAPAAPVAYWPFDTGTISGQTVLDSSGNGIYGTIIGGVTSVPGEVGQALSFDGSTGYVQTQNNSLIGINNDITVAAWIQTTNNTRNEAIINNYNLSGSEQGYVFETTAAGYLALHLGGNNILGTRDFSDNTNRINDGNWHFVAVVVRLGEDVTFYVDGGMSSIYYLTTYGTAIGVPAGIGGPANPYANFFTGSIDEVRLYARALAASDISTLYGGPVSTAAGGQILYNGIAMPLNFPPQTQATQMYRTPYYISSPPRVIPIDLGRQLFVDDFLIGETTLTRTQHQPDILQANPVITPGAPISAGAWWNPSTQQYQLWYYDGTNNDYRYADSLDGMSWLMPTFPDVYVPNTNQVVPGGDTIWLDLQETDPNKRYKAFQVDVGALKVYLYFSSDGIHWGPAQDFGINTLSDRTTFFWNPFRNVWVNSDRDSAGVPTTPNRTGYDPRVRFYSESPDLMTWTPSNPALTFWTGPDDHDPPYYLNNPGGEPPELYNLDAVAYESVLVGLFSWFYPGAPYDNYTLPGPILVELGVGFSRDGFSWFRPTRGSGPGPGGAFIPASDTAGTWNAYNTQSVGGLFTVVGDQLYFYFSARTLQKPLDGTFSTGLATLRRDGFYSMDAGSTEGTLITHPVKFSGNHMFVNVSDPSGTLYVEVLDQNGTVIAPFSKSNCIPISGDTTLQEVKWNGVTDLSSLAGQNVEFKFYLTNGELYSFWVTPSAQGASYGYVAAGGPGFTGVTDTVGGQP